MDEWLGLRPTDRPTGQLEIRATIQLTDRASQSAIKLDSSQLQTAIKQTLDQINLFFSVFVVLFRFGRIIKANFFH